MFKDVAPERSGTELLAGLSGLIVSTGHQLRFRHPILREVAYAGLPYRRRRELHAKALRFWKPPPPRRTAAPSSSHFTTSWPATTTKRWTTAGGPESGRWHATRQPPPPTPTEGGQAARLSSSVSPSERSFLPGSAGRCRVLGGPVHRGCRAYLEALRGVRGQPLREAHLALKRCECEHAAATTAMHSAGESRPARC
jgi:hypothetical protein